EDAMELPVPRREALDVARLVEPRQIDPAADAAVLAVDLKTFLEIAACGDLKIEVTQRTIFVIHGDEPAIGAEAFEQPGADADDRPAEVSRRVHQVAAVREDEVAPSISFRVALGAECPAAGHRDWLEVVGHRVAI